MKKYINKFYTFSLIIITLIFISSCSEDDAAPAEENEEEVITDVKLIFTNSSNASDIVEARAQDPDGTGVKELQILDSIILSSNTTYNLTFEIMNNLETPGEDIGAEILREGTEHQIFFGFIPSFSSPSGSGNIDYSGPINYGDTDANGNPIGLKSSWTTFGGLALFDFTVRLQHQPDIKTSSTGANDGDTDFELSFKLWIL